MNCKQGDLAIIVRSEAGNEGKIVRCLKLLPNNHWICCKTGIHSFADGWEIDQQVRLFTGGTTNRVPDYRLRPIRDQDGEDEMLRIAGKPERMTA